LRFLDSFEELAYLLVAEMERFFQFFPLSVATIHDEGDPCDKS